MTNTTEEVTLVDEHDRPIGVLGKLAAHRGEGHLHRAVSVVLLNPQGELLLQQRAGCKYHFPHHWSNTCCGHPRPGESVVEAATRRLREEMDISVPLRRVAQFIYRASDPASGLVEHELDHVLVGDYAGSPNPDPAEVQAWRWEAPHAVLDALRSGRDLFTPWLPLVIAELDAS